MVRLGDNIVGEENDEESVDTARVSLDDSHDPYFPPVVTLPLVEIPTGEDEEDVLLSMRAKLFRYDHCADPHEWKERGTGDVKLLQHKETRKIRLLMRRDKTWKVCANHYIEPWMLLKPMMSERAWMWLVHSDFADEEAKTETFAIRFSTSEMAQTFKAGFEDAVGKVTIMEATQIKADEDGEKKSQKLSGKVESKPESGGDSSQEAVADKLSSLQLDTAEAVVEGETSK